MRYSFLSALALLLALGSERVVAQDQSYFAIGTNLLYDAALMPNAELEVTAGQHLSLLAEWTSPWWLNERKQRCLELINGGIEGRWWFSPKDKKTGQWSPLQGHFAGFAFHVGYYDIERKGEGYQGDLFWSPTLTYGYGFRLSRQLRLDCSFGVGFMHTEYQHYHHYEVNQSHYLLTVRRGSYNWFGPTKAKVSIKWIPQLMKREKGVRR